MPNMSYCRFRNTLMHLEDCADAIDDIEGPNDPDRPEDEEREAADGLRAMCERYIKTYDTAFGR